MSDFSTSRTSDVTSFHTFNVKPISDRKRLYWERKLAGRCVDCNAGLTDEDTGVRCVEHRAAEVSRNKAYAAKPRVRKAIQKRERSLRAERVANRLCMYCGEPLHERLRNVSCAGCRRHRRITNAARKAGSSGNHGTDITPIRMPTIPYQPIDEREQNMRVRMLRALWRLTNDGEWADAADILLAASVEMNDERGGSRERNRAEVMLGRLTKGGVVDRRGERKSYFYRVNEISRAEVRAWRVGELPNARGARAA